MDLKTTNNLKYYIVCFIMLNLFSSNLYAQTDLPTATINPDMLIILDGSKELSDKYAIDISVLSIATEEDAVNLFNSFRDNILNFDIDYPNNKVILILHREYTTPDWSVEEWNNYLKSKSDLFISVKE